MPLRSKLRPRGPVVCWHPRTWSTAPLAASPASVDVSSSKSLLDNPNSWALGRSLRLEEQRCGLLCNTTTAPLSRADGTRSAAAASNALQQRQPMQHQCVIKAQCSDWQFNEVDADGSVATITRQVRGRWRKIDRGETYLVEDDSREGFDDPEKSFTPRAKTYGKYARLMGKISNERPVLDFVVYRDNHTVDAVTNRMQYEASVASEATFFSSRMGGFGCVTQRGTSLGVTEEILPHASRLYNLHPVVFDPRQMHSVDELARLRRPHRGFFFRMVLRCVSGTPSDVASTLETLRHRHFVNYFDLSHFQATTNRAFEVAALAAAGDYHASVSLFAQSLAERSPVHHGHFLRYLRACDDTCPEVLREWHRDAKDLRLERNVVDFLDRLASASALSATSSSAAAETAWQQLWEVVPNRGAYYMSGAKFVWNAMASQRLMRHGPRVVVGDLVTVATNARAPDSQLSQPNSFDFLSSVQHRADVRIVTTEADAKQFTLADVVLPLPVHFLSQQQLQSRGCLMFPRADGVREDDYRHFAEAHRLQYIVDAAKVTSDIHAAVTDAQLTGSVPVAGEPSSTNALWYRPLLAAPEHLQYRIVKDPSSLLALKSDHHVLQERKSLEHFVTIDEARVREPSPYNVSEKFVEKMRPIVARNRGNDLSVVLSGFLPRGSHPTVMLRDNFDAKHVAFRDLLDSPCGAMN